MAVLQLTYDNKYRLWSEVVQGNTDRLFVPVDALPDLHQDVIVRVSVGDSDRRYDVVGSVVGVRQGSRRFATGAYVHIPAVELTKLRKLLELRPTERRYDGVRRASRVHYEVPAALPEADPEARCLTRNISYGGIFLTGTTKLTDAQEVSVVLTVEPEPLRIDARVAWVDAEQGAAGLRFTELTQSQRSHLADLIEQGRELERMASDRPVPIVVADDEDSIGEFIANALSKHGYEVYRAKTGDETLNLVRELHPALLLLDILMPKMDGSEVCKVMRADVDLATIPVIFLSALEPSSLHAVADESGATDYLSKPVRLSQLLTLVGQYLKLDPFPEPY